eukprot:s62_g20.t2
MWTLQFALLSGQEVTVQAEPEETVDDVLNKAQEALNVLIVSVVSSSGTLLDITRSLEDEGVQDGDRLLCVVDRPDPACQWHNKSLIFAALREDGGLVVWGGSSCCEVPDDLRNVETVCTNSGAIAAITEGKDFSLLLANLEHLATILTCWDQLGIFQCKGGDSSAVEHLLFDVRCVCPSSYAFAALKNDGSVVCWGCASAGGDCSAVQDNMHWSYGLLMFVHSGWHGKNGPAFEKGEERKSEIVILFGALTISGSICSTAICSPVPMCLQDQLHDVCHLSGATWAFTAVKGDGSAVTWGDERKGGDSSAVQDGSGKRLKLVAQLITQVQKGGLCGSCSYSALFLDIDEHCHCSKSYFEDSRYQEQLVNVKSVCASSWSFAALRHDGHVITWGVDKKGGDSRSVQSQLYKVLQLRSTSWAFAALRSDGLVITWGDPQHGGDGGQVQSQLKSICQICACADAFAALDRRGSVVSWGALPTISLHDVQRLSASSLAFAALKKDGTVDAWGDRLAGARSQSKGGDISRVQPELVNVQQICGSSWAFAALLGDRTVISWGDPEHGGNSSQVQERLKNVAIFQCLTRLGKQLACGHSCSSQCHAGECKDCSKPCGARRVHCSHTCQAPCHPGSECEDTPCRWKVKQACPCGQRVEERSCGAYSELRRPQWPALRCLPSCERPSLPPFPEGEPVKYTADLFQLASQHRRYVQMLEETFATAILSRKGTDSSVPSRTPATASQLQALPSCDSSRRLLAIEYARLHWRFKTSSKSDAVEGWWQVSVAATASSRFPRPLLSEIAISSGSSVESEDFHIPVPPLTAEPHSPADPVTLLEAKEPKMADAGQEVRPLWRAWNMESTDDTGWRDLCRRQAIELTLTVVALCCWTIMCVLDLFGWQNGLDSESDVASQILSLSSLAVSCIAFTTRPCCVSRILQKDPDGTAGQSRLHYQLLILLASQWSLLCGALIWLVYQASSQRHPQVIAGVVAVFILLILLLCSFVYLLHAQRKRLTTSVDLALASVDPQADWTPDRSYSSTRKPAIEVPERSDDSDDAVSDNYVRVASADDLEDPEQFTNECGMRKQKSDEVLRRSRGRWRPLFPTFMASSLQSPTMSRTSMLSLGAGGEFKRGTSIKSFRFETEKEVEESLEKEIKRHTLEVNCALQRSTSPSPSLGSVPSQQPKAAALAAPVACQMDLATKGVAQVWQINVGGPWTYP